MVSKTDEASWKLKILFVALLSIEQNKTRCYLPRLSLIKNEHCDWLEVIDNGQIPPWRGKSYFLTVKTGPL